MMSIDNSLENGLDIGLENVGQVAFSENHVAVTVNVDGTDILATIHSTDPKVPYVVATEESITNEGDRHIRYLKLQRHILEASKTVVEYYRDHDSLVKGVGAVGAVAGFVAVGSLAVLRTKKTR